MKGEHFIIDNTWEVPAFLDEVMATFGEEEYEAHVLDIEGCFPSMPKDKIVDFVRSLLLLVYNKP